MKLLLVFVLILFIHCPISEHSVKNEIPVVELIAGYEGFRTSAYHPTRHDKPTIGFGHTYKVRIGDTLHWDHAIVLLKDHVFKIQRAVMQLSPNLNKCQLAAVTSLVYNIGLTKYQNSDMRKYIAQNNFSLAHKQFARWNKQKGVELKGLTSRRNSEAKLFGAKSPVCLI